VLPVPAVGSVQTIKSPPSTPCLGVHTGTGLPDILCGPRFEQLSADPNEKSVILREAEELFTSFYGMAEHILTANDREERTRQAAEGRDIPSDLGNL